MTAVLAYVQYWPGVILVAVAGGPYMDRLIMIRRVKGTPPHTHSGPRFSFIGPGAGSWFLHHLSGFPFTICFHFFLQSFFKRFLLRPLSILAMRVTDY